MSPVPITWARDPRAAVLTPSPGPQTSLKADPALAPALDGAPLVGGVGRFWAAAPASRCVLAPTLGRERLWTGRGFALWGQFFCVVRSAFPRVGVCLTVEPAGRQAGVALFVEGVAVAPVVVVVVVLVVVGVVVVAVGVVVVTAVLVVAGVALVVVVVAVRSVEAGVVLAGVLSVSVGTEAPCVALPVVVAVVGAALAACALPAAVAPPTQAFSALDMATVLAISDSRERHPARELWARSL
jgi:hypothetical protein